DVEAVDDDGVVHQLWVIDDPDTIRAVRHAAETSPVVVADGHHRYDTARTYLRQCEQAPGTATTEGSVMALLVELSEHELAVGPIHRGLSGLPEGIDLVD